MPPSSSADATISVPGFDAGWRTTEDLALFAGPAIYLVAIDDGGSRGARFGCNDSLVAVRSAAVGSSASGGSASDGSVSGDLASGGSDSGGSDSGGSDSGGSVSGDLASGGSVSGDGQVQAGQASAGPAIAPQDPLAAAMARLLGPDAVPTGSNLYNALAASTLTYVSGRLDGSTAVVDLRGGLRQGGVCDSPRIDAQLTQTAIAATGASRADIRINGRPLAEFLDLR